MRRGLLIVVGLGLIGGVMGCGLFEPVGLHPQLSLAVEPFQADVSYPLTILLAVPEAGRAADVQPEALAGVEPVGFEARYPPEKLPFVEEIRPVAVTYPSPEWIGTAASPLARAREPSVERVGIYTVRLRGRFVKRGGGTDSEESRQEDVFRGVVAGPVPEEALSRLAVPVAYTLSLKYPSPRGYLVEVERGGAVELPLRVRSRVEGPLRLRLTLAPRWRVPSGVRLLVPPTEEVELAGQGVWEATLRLEAAPTAPSGRVLLYVMGEIVGGETDGRWPEAIPIDLRIR